MDKPTYSVPSMAEIAALPWNGRNVISTFSGGGGSSLGYRMAGYRVLWASEFVEAARDTYKANSAGTILDARDIREVQPSDILDAIGMAPGDLDLFDGSPPCASFSTAGSRQKGWGKVRKYSDTQQRTDDLFDQYVRLLRGLKPKVFVAENVSGLVKGKAKGYFLQILQELRASGYDVQAKLLDAQWLGVPQARQRLFFVGVRCDLVAKYGVAPAFPKPLPYRYTVAECLPWIKRLKLTGRQDNWAEASRPASTVTLRDGARASMTGYLSSYVVEAETDISRYAIGEEWEKMEQGTASSKYFSLKRNHVDRPSLTVTATGGLTSAASITHPTEKRKFSIQELRRICSFPDDFILTGDFAQQWERLGRSVPPVMMMHLAQAINTQVFQRVTE